MRMDEAHRQAAAEALAELQVDLPPPEVSDSLRASLQRRAGAL